MNTTTFDTHAAAKRYKAAGFSDDQVEALVEIARETTSLPDVSQLATKTDLSLATGKIRNHTYIALAAALAGIPAVLEFLKLVK